MKIRQLLTTVTACIGLAFISSTTVAQTTYTGVFRSPPNTSTYHQFIKSGAGAAVYINQVATNQPILRLSSGTATANVNVVMTVENDGSVGIGTTTPQAKLAVNGNILAKEIKIKTDISVPDYVFEDTYNLPSLSSVENYVKEHKHLPEVPSAKDIEENGLDVAGMNLLLLKKVEELTLHLIEKEKEVADMKNGMDKMEERIHRLENGN